MRRFIWIADVEGRDFIGIKLIVVSMTKEDSLVMGIGDMEDKVLRRIRSVAGKIIRNLDRFLMKLFDQRI